MMTDEAVDSIFKSMAHANQIQMLAWAEYRVDPVYAMFVERRSRGKGD